MILSKKVNRLEYITRNGFDNTVDEKKQLMEYFSKLDRAEILKTDELAALRAENAKLREALIKAESALTYANWDGTFDDTHTLQDVINARDEARRALESHE